MGSSQNDSPLSGILEMKGRIVLGIQKGAINLSTDDIVVEFLM